MSERPLRPTSTPGIFRRGNRYVVVLRDRQGKQFKRAAATLLEARHLKAQLTTDVAHGLASPANRITFAEYAEEWMETYSGRTSRGIREVTLKRYRDTIRRDAMPFLGAMMLNEIEPRDLKRYAQHVAETGVSANTVRLRLAPVKLLFATAFEDGVVRSNPAAGLRNMYGVRKDETRPKALTEAELERLLEEADPMHRFLLQFLSETGLRIGELIGLEWRDIDTEAARLRVERRWFDGSLDAPKSHFGIRVVPLSKSVVAELEWRRDTVDPEPRDPVFISSHGTRLDASNVLERMMKPAAVRAGVPWAHLHTLRHTCASRLFKMGWNAKHVQLVLGHHSPAFTLATYVHLMPDDLPDVSFG